MKKGFNLITIFFMRFITSILLCMLLIMSPSCKSIQEKGLFGRKAKRFAELLAQQNSIRVADSLKRVENRIKAIEEARLDSLKLAEEERLLTESHQRYNIVVGSFLTHENASGWVGVYRNQGFDPKIIKMSNSDFELVVAESHPQFPIAAERLDYFQTEIDIDAWLYIRK